MTTMKSGRELLEILLQRRKVLAGFADMALQSEDLDEVLQEACRLVAAAMQTKRAKVLEIEPGGGTLFVRAGVGWAPDVVGQVRLSMREHSSETYAIDAGEPVISQDIAEDHRFEVPAFMKEAGVVALVNVPTSCRGGGPTASCRWTTRSRATSTRMTALSCAPTPASWVRSSTGCSSWGICDPPKNASA
ncbi:GAF domain-containing protein [Paracoccus sp. S-4012]|uniref:GAF domain-containing protein n=1 Tax=Paracoccus sp. S-4012 TaxID=2665648 RepID=UPI001E55891B|nr:GAF domain-containing protein [Paracoccus sp. S-4012]